MRGCELRDAIEMGFDRHFPADLYVPEARAALDTLASELERVRAENARFHSQNRDFKVTVGALAAAVERSEARLDRAVGALREICDIGETRDVEVARAALAEIEESA